MFLAIFQQNPAAAVALLLGLVIGIVLHEAAHGVASTRGIKDTSRQGRYHNRRFAEGHTHDSEIALLLDADARLGEDGVYPVAP